MGLHDVGSIDGKESTADAAVSHECSRSMYEGYDPAQAAPSQLLCILETTRSVRGQ